MATATLNAASTAVIIVDSVNGRARTRTKPVSLIDSILYTDGNGNQIFALVQNGTNLISVASAIDAEGYGNTIFGVLNNPAGAQTAAEGILGAKGGGVGAGSIGDCKSGLQAADHNGWIVLNGRLKSTLTTTQQAAATSLGIGANLPDATGRAFVQGTRGAQIGSSTILQANLPAVTLIGGNHGHSISDPGHTHQTQQANNGTFNSNGAAGAPVGFGNSFTTSTSTTGIGVGASGNISIPLGGNGASYTPAAIGVNQFLFLGS
jgi:hypothetical protein